MLLRSGLRAVVATVLTLWSLLLLAWLALHWLILPHIDEWRGRIEAQASLAVGLPVRIGHIEVRTPGWVPVFELREVSLSDRQGREALRLPRVTAAVAPQSLLALRLRFAQLHVEGAQLLVRRDAQGGWHVGGLDLNEGASLDGGSAAGDWIFQQHEIAVLGGRLRWVDEQGGGDPLLLQQVDLVLRNGLRRHDWRLDATPPPEWGERFSLRGRFRQPLLARAGDWQRWSGTVYAELPWVDAAVLRSQLSFPLDLSQGRAALRGWLDLEKGQWRRAVADVALGEVRLRLADGLEALDLRAMTGRLGAERLSDGLRLSTQGLDLQLADGLHWPLGQATLSWREPPQPGGPRLALPDPGRLTGGDLSAEHLDLAVLAELAERLPLPASLRRQLAELAPAGQVQGLQLNWTGSPEAPSRYRLRGRVEGLVLAALPAPQTGAIGRPGTRQASLVLDANERGGQAQLAIQDGALSLPGVFAEPEVPLDRFSGQLVWQVRPVAGGPPAIELQLQDGRFANADAQGELQLRWQTGPGPAGSFGKGGRLPGLLDLSGKLQRGRAAAVARYLPLEVDAAARDYVAAAVRDGDIPRASFKVRGDLWDFPFAQGQEGEFRLAAQVERLTLAYVPPAQAGAEPAWPPFTEVQGELIFDRGSMEIRRARAKVWGVVLQGVNGQIRDLTRHAALDIEGAGRGPLNDALRYVGASPVGGWTHHALREANGSGEAELRLALHIPLDDAERTTVRGSVTLAGNELRLRPEVPLLSNARARIDFSQRGFAIVGGSARALGGELSLEGGSQADGSVRLNAQGTASAEALRRSPELGASLNRLAGAFSGQAPYKLQLGFLRGGTEFQLSSPLTGLGLELPAPLRKPAAEVWPLKVQSTLGPEGGAQASRDSLRIELGSVLQAELQRELLTDGPRLLRGSLGLGEPLPALPASGIAAAVRLGGGALEPWLALAQRLQPEGGGASASALPLDLQLKTPSLQIEGRPLTQLSASVQRRWPAGEAGEAWRVQFTAEQAQGQLDWRPAPARLSARLARLSWPALESAATPLESPALPDSGRHAAWPALDIVVDALDWHGHALGRLELEAPAASADGRDWRLTRLNLTGPDARLSASGTWSAQPRRRMALDLGLDIADSGALLERLGMGKVVRGGKGRIQGQLAWNGDPFSPDWAQSSGNLQLALESGQFLKVEPGAARLLGVLSLQSLPRRLTLDFRDVFQQGFAFDNVTGDVHLAAGVAGTANLQIRGPQAGVLVEGQADLRRETQDLRVLIVPDMNAGTASLAYAAVNPVIGLGTFLAQYMLRGPLQQAGTKALRITGSWDHPQVETLERPPAAASAPASGAAR